MLLAALQVGLGKDTKATFTLGFTKSNELFVGRLASALALLLAQIPAFTPLHAILCTTSRPRPDMPHCSAAVSHVNIGIHTLSVVVARWN